MLQKNVVLQYHVIVQKNVMLESLELKLFSLIVKGLF